jgi:biotin-dependent carboxylase-like uncharacterized protein
MALAKLKVVQVGPLVTIQDRGRAGLMRFGVPASGPMDRQSFAIAHAAIGNPATVPAIEVSMGGLTLECAEGNVTFAVVGGGFQVDLDQTPLGAWTVATLRAGSRLTIKPGHWGSWTYLAFAGRLLAKSWLGSSATLAISDLGGGRITLGQELVIADAEVRENLCGAIPCPVTARPRERLKVILGPQDRFFSNATIQKLLSEPFTLTDAYDRMGVRLAGPSLAPDAQLDMPSEAIVRGSIQVSGDGVPTILLADHQTTGGYPKIATILSDDLDGFVQLRARNRVTFAAITPDAAVQTGRARQRMNRQYAERLATRATALAARLMTENDMAGVFHRGPDLSA